MIEGIEIKKANSHVTICVVSDFSEQLKVSIRENLVKICHGAKKAEFYPNVYSYKATLGDFLLRYEKKRYKQKIGMIGELIAHILLLHDYNYFKSVNPFFNMEEKNVKKGFDLVLVDTFTNQLWITEVKSGLLGNMKNSSKKNQSLLSKAKSDLVKRLNANDRTLWYNAINGADIAMKENNIKEEIIHTLHSCIIDSSNECANSSDKNVILASVLFNDTSDSIDITNTEKYHESQKKAELFKDIIFFTIHKNTYEKVYGFLKEEVSDE